MRPNFLDAATLDSTTLTTLTFLVLAAALFLLPTRGTASKPSPPKKPLVAYSSARRLPTVASPRLSTPVLAPPPASLLSSPPSSGKGVRRAPRFVKHESSIPKKAVEAEAAAPSAPTTTVVDDRPLVSDLIAENASKIEALRELVKVDPLYDANRHDDLWLLRYLLSHTRGGVKAAAKAARYTLAWREENRMDELAAELNASTALEPAIAHPDVVKVHKIHVKPHGIRHIQPDKTRGPVLLANMVDFDYATTVKLISRDEYAMMIKCMLEWVYIQCDRVTRETGKLTKSARFIQVKGLSAFSLDREWLKLDGQVAKEMEDCYPQALGIIICLNPPTWALIVWRAAKFLFPARMVEKIDLVSTAGARKEVHKRARKWIDLEQLPSSYGGNGPDLITEDGRRR